MNPQIFWIMGAGRFGRLAWERLGHKMPDATIRVVDRLGAAVPPGAEMIKADVVDFLRENMPPRTDAWIIPTVPVHLAYEWLAKQLERDREVAPQAVPTGLMPHLPNACRGPEGQVFISNADFRCPDNCSENGSNCIYTRKPRPRVMHTYLADLVFQPYGSVVLRSLQLASGVGGFQATTLWRSYQALRSREGHFLFSTACKCHAVMNAFTLA